jgi:hypothetical protein
MVTVLSKTLQLQYVVKCHFSCNPNTPPFPSSGGLVTIAFPDSVLVDEAEDKADAAVSSDKKPDNAEAGSGLETVVPASQTEKRTSNTGQAVKILIFRAKFQRQEGRKRRRLGRHRLSNEQVADNVMGSHVPSCEWLAEVEDVGMRADYRNACLSWTRQPDFAQRWAIADLALETCV